MIWLISLGIDSLALLPSLRYGNQKLLTLIDMTMSNHDEYHRDAVAARLCQHCHWLRDQGCTHIILPPLREYLWSKIDFSSSHLIVPLFERYVRHALSYSLVGKIWWMMSMTDDQLRKQYPIKEIFLSYPLTERQAQTKRFAQPRHHRSITIPHRLPLLRHLPTRDIMLSTQIKHDCRSLKDAWVDTLIPCQWSFFLFHRSFRTIFQSSRYRLHPLTIATDSLALLSHPQSSPCNYTLAIIGNDTVLSHPHRKFVTWCHRENTKPVIITLQS